jgi:hypothetical protein
MCGIVATARAREASIVQSIVRLKRRAFLRGVSVGGVALVAPWARVGAARRSTPPRKPVLELLRDAHIKVVSRLTPFDGATIDILDLALEGPRPARRTLKVGLWTLSAAPVPDRADAVDLVAKLKVGAHPVDTGCGIGLQLGNWSRDAYAVMPGAAYAGNRFESRYAGHSPALLTEPADIGPNVPPIVGDVPHLNVHAGPSVLDVLVADLATPAAAIWLPAEKLGLIMLVDPVTPIGRTGLALSETEDRSRASLVVSAPYVYDGGRANSGSRGPGRGGPLRAGDLLTMRARVHAFACDDVPSLFARLFAVRQDLTGPTQKAHELPFSAAFAAHEERVNRRWVDTGKRGFLASGACDSAYTTWQNGWGGGLVATLPLLAAGSVQSGARALSTVDFALHGGQAPSGFFHAASDGKSWFDDGFTAPLPDRRATPASYRQARRWHLVRRSADTLAALVKLLALVGRRPSLVKADPALPEAWGKAARACADAFVRLWERHHQLGQFVDVESGELVVGGSTAAALAPAGLALAARLFSEPRYQKVALAAAELFYERYVRAGLTCGGPGDALQSPDGQSAAALVESFVTIHELTREPVWLDRARAAAHLAASWVISYDAPPTGRDCNDGDPPRATGAVLWDAQSRRGSPGYLLSSGEALFRLYRATGDASLLALLGDTVHNLAQYLTRAEAATPATAGTRPNARPCSRADTSRWLEPGGIVPVGSAFDTIAMLAYTELPGLYANIDKGFVFVFDHLDARIKEHMSGKLVVALTNPTKHESVVRLFAETDAEAAEPLRTGAIAEAPTVTVAPGSTLEVLLPFPVAAMR